MMIDVDAVNRTDAIAILSSGGAIPITNWLDASGDECEADDAMVAVAGPDADGRWFSIDLSNFEPSLLH